MVVGVKGSPGGASGNTPANAGDIKRVRSLGQEDPLEEGMATHSSILAWRIQWTEEPGGLQYMESQRSQTRLKQLSSNGSGIKWYLTVAVIHNSLVT